MSSKTNAGWADNPAYLALRARLNHAWIRRIDDLLRSEVEKAYEKGWKQRDKDYQDIGEKPPEVISKARREAVESFAKELEVFLTPQPGVKIIGDTTEFARQLSLHILALLERWKG